jgi:hypothetical protein
VSVDNVDKVIEKRQLVCGFRHHEDSVVCTPSICSVTLIVTGLCTVLPSSHIYLLRVRPILNWYSEYPTFGDVYGQYSTRYGNDLSLNSGLSTCLTGQDCGRVCVVPLRHCSLL